MHVCRLNAMQKKKNGFNPFIIYLSGPKKSGVAFSHEYLTTQNNIKKVNAGEMLK